MRRPAVYLLAAATVAVLGLNWPIMSGGRRPRAAAVARRVPDGRRRARGRGGDVDARDPSSAGRRSPDPVERRPRPARPRDRARVQRSRVRPAGAFLDPRVHGEPVDGPARGARSSTSASRRCRIAGLALGSAGVVLLLEPWALDWSDDAGPRRSRHAAGRGDRERRDDRAHPRAPMGGHAVRADAVAARGGGRPRRDPRRRDRGHARDPLDDGDRGDRRVSDLARLRVRVLGTAHDQPQPPRDHHEPHPDGGPGRRASLVDPRSRTSD